MTNLCFKSLVIFSLLFGLNTSASAKDFWNNLLALQSFRNLPSNYSIIRGDVITDSDTELVGVSLNNDGKEVLMFEIFDGDGMSLGKQILPPEIKLNLRSGVRQVLRFLTSIFQTLDHDNIALIRFTYDHPKRLLSSQFSSQDIGSFILLKAMMESLGLADVQFQGSILFGNSKQMNKKTMILPAAISWKAGDYRLAPKWQKYLRSPQFGNDCEVILNMKRY